ncbi:sperm-associated antigen 1 [Anastrepha ludens]|uniref:sperm-associated antigen 1 n=1 Tax=Anastrepha ludens TaxID=28586 RepID=UPI0023B0FB1D|nr:sperm-associated antigen 1 [Anastrepha ludens]
MEGTAGKRKLIEKYEMPLSHLDFGYIRECKSIREMEKIVKILRSGEEGHFPDLTKCAEDKLRELKPNSRLFRYEEQLRGREALTNQEWKPIFEWTNSIKVKESELSAAAAEKTAADLGVPPVRKSGTIKESVEKIDPKIPQSNIESTAAASKSVNKTTDYQKWSKYDADEECLRMELADERMQEEVERKNRLNKQKSKMQPIPEGSHTAANSAKQAEVMSKLTAVERERLAEQYRLRGNDYFRAKEYEKAIEEYDRSITVCPEKAAPAHNNRAAANIKLKWYTKAIKDCELCLRLEPDNLKARLRLAEATYCDGRRQESYALYMKVLELEPQNPVALKAITQLRSLFVELPPPNATRLQIVEDNKPRTTEQDTHSKAAEKSSIAEKPAAKSTQVSESSSSTAISNPPKTKPIDYDLSDLIKPNRLVKNKLATAAAALSNMQATKVQKQQNPQNKFSPSVETPSFQPDLRLPSNAPKMSGKLLIEEI